jgi:gamma-glutamyltranspeptidase/glutathione hydrolase
MSGVVAAGHPESAAAGATALREGGNAVDAAVAAMLASFAVESPLTGLGAGGFMMVHRGGETTLLDFFVAAPGLDGGPRTEELAPVDVVFDAETVQTFYVGPVSCGVPGTPAGLDEALRRFGSMPLGELAAPAIRLAREGAPVNHEQAYILEILAPIHERLPGTRELYAPEGRTLREAETFRFPELAEALERLVVEGVAPFYRGEVAAALSDFVIERGGTLGDRARRHPRTRRPRRLRGDRAGPGAGALPRHRGPDQPAALGRRHADRLRPRRAAVARPAERPRAAGRGDGRRQRAPR